MQTRMPPHIEVMIRKNPNAVLTPRGIVAKRTDRIDELLMGLPNADKIYSEHFDEIRSEQSANHELVKQKTTEAAPVGSKDDGVVPDTEGESKMELPEKEQQVTASEQTDVEAVQDTNSTEKELAFPNTDDERTAQEVSDQIVEQNGYTDPFDAAFAEAKLNPKYKDLSDVEIKKRVQMSLAAKERAAKKKAEAEAAKSTS